MSVCLQDVDVLFMQSDGGLTPMEQFCGSRAILSGPAGGVVGYAITSYSQMEKKPVIGFDMGGECMWEQRRQLSIFWILSWSLFVWSSYSLLSSMCHIQDLIFLILWSKVTLLFWAMFLTLVFIFSFSCLHALVCCCLQERPQMWVGMQASMSMCLRLPQLESPCKHLSWTSTLWLQAEDRDCFSGKFAQIV